MNCKVLMGLRKLSAVILMHVVHLCTLQDRWQFLCGSCCSNKHTCCVCFIDSWIVIYSFCFSDLSFCYILRTCASSVVITLSTLHDHNHQVWHGRPSVVCTGSYTTWRDVIRKSVTFPANLDQLGSLSITCFVNIFCKVDCQSFFMISEPKIQYGTMP